MTIKKNETVRFTIIIPTRERCDVLKSALKTCTTQDYGNIEIIISDNFSQDKTRDIVESFKDARIRYINTGKRVSMVDNWEFALSHVDGGYVTFLGDDDGILPGALAELNKIISRTGCEAISCKAVGYSWPDHVDEAVRNILRIPLQESLIKRNSEEMLTDVLNFKRDPYELPSIYRGFVSYDAIRRVIKESGRFFHSMIPDIYSGIALACVIESYYYSFKPYVISGASRHSGGARDSNLDIDHQAAKKFLTENSVPFHSKLEYVLSWPIIVAESFLQAQDHMPCARHFKMDIKKCVEEAIREASHFSKKRYETIVEALKKVAHLNQIDRHLSQVITKYKNKPALIHYPVLGFNIVRRHLVIDCVEFGVKDVYEAAVLCGHILALKKRGYLSLKGIIKTTISYVKREIINSNII